MLNKKFSHNSFLMLFLGLFGVHIFLFFPGLMSVDSIGIYAQALKNSYSLHHPPFMGMTWNFLDKIYKGPALMYLFNLGLLWGGIYLLSFKVFKEKKLRLLCLFIPFTPHILVYSGWIWKDIIFTYGYALIAIYLATKTTRKEPLKFKNLMILVLALVYFTEIKYQARFVLPIMLLWIFHLYFKDEFLKKIIGTFFSYLIIMFSVNVLDTTLISQKKDINNHSWQCVKIFDLAGMSIYSGKILMPRALWKKQNLSLENVRRKYELAWEPLVVYDDSPFCKATTQITRDTLLITWQKAIMDYPFSYLKHRFNIWFNGLILTGPGSLWIERKTASHPSLKKFVPIISNSLAYIFILPLQILILIQALLCLRKNEKKLDAIVVIYLNAMSLTLLTVLFIFSLAAVPRYVYFSMVFFFLSTPFSLRLLRK